MTDKVLKKVSEDEKLRELRLAREKMELWIAMERRAGYDNGRSEGYSEGYSEGEFEGADNKAREIAANMKSDGEPIKKIEAYTGLSEEEIAKL